MNNVKLIITAIAVVFCAIWAVGTFIGKTENKRYIVALLIINLGLNYLLRLIELLSE